MIKVEKTEQWDQFLKFMIDSERKRFEREREDAGAVFMAIVRRDLETFEPFGDGCKAVLYQPTIREEDNDRGYRAKHALAAAAKSITIAGDALACMLSLQSWGVELDEGEVDDGTPAGTHENARECVTMLFEHQLLGMTLLHAPFAGDSLAPFRQYRSEQFEGSDSALLMGPFLPPLGFRGQEQHSYAAHVARLYIREAFGEIQFGNFAE